MSDAIGVVNSAGLRALKEQATAGNSISAEDALKLIEALTLGHKHIFELHESLAMIKVLAKQAQEEIVRIKVEMQKNGH